MRRLENHHIAGEKHSALTVTLCNIDHMPITNRQMCWDSRWNYTNNAENVQASFVIQGIQELLIQKHYVTGIPDYRLLADSLSPLVKLYRDRL